MVSPAAACRRCRAASRRPWRRLRLARRPQRGQRQHLHLGAGKSRARDGPVGDQAQDRLQPVVAGVVQVVGLGGGEQRCGRCGAAEQRDSQVLAPGRKHVRIAVHARARRSATRVGAGVERGQHIDQHDLPVEPGEVVAEERLHHMRLIGSRSGAPSCAQRAARAGRRRCATGGSGQKVSGRRAFEVARQQEAARAAASTARESARARAQIGA